MGRTHNRFFRRRFFCLLIATVTIVAVAATSASTSSDIISDPECRVGSAKGRLLFEGF